MIFKNLPNKAFSFSETTSLASASNSAISISLTRVTWSFSNEICDSILETFFRINIVLKLIRCEEISKSI